jgi:hypothetical protein
LPTLATAAAFDCVKSFEVTGFQNFFKAHGKVKWQDKVVIMQQFCEKVNIIKFSK